jgi:uncharacterized membrane protein YuzA (DUF378 family)
MKNLDVLGWWFMVIGAIVWGLVGLGGLLNLGNLNLVNLVLGSSPVLESVVYLLVGLAGVMSLYSHVSAKK